MPRMKFAHRVHAETGQPPYETVGRLDEFPIGAGDFGTSSLLGLRLTPPFRRRALGG